MMGRGPATAEAPAATLPISALRNGIAPAQMHFACSVAS